MKVIAGAHCLDGERVCAAFFGLIDGFEPCFFDFFAGEIAGFEFGVGFSPDGGVEVGCGDEQAALSASVDGFPEDVLGLGECAELSEPGRELHLRVDEDADERCAAGLEGGFGEPRDFFGDGQVIFEGAGCSGSGSEASGTFDELWQDGLLSAFDELDASFCGGDERGGAFGGVSLEEARGAELHGGGEGQEEGAFALSGVINGVECGLCDLCTFGGDACADEECGEVYADAGECEPCFGLGRGLDGGFGLCDGFSQEVVCSSHIAEFLEDECGFAGGGHACLALFLAVGLFGGLEDFAPERDRFLALACDACGARLFKGFSDLLVLRVIGHQRSLVRATRWARHRAKGSGFALALASPVGEVRQRVSAQSLAPCLSKIQGAGGGRFPRRRFAVAPRGDAA